MRRRQLLSLLGGTAVSRPLAARAQQPALPLIGRRTSRAADDVPHLLAAFRQGLKEVGFVDGRNVTMEFRFADNQIERLPALAADLVQRQVIVIAALTTSAALAAKARLARAFPSCSKAAVIRFGSVWTPACIGREATLLGDPIECGGRAEAAGINARTAPYGNRHGGPH